MQEGNILIWIHQNLTFQHSFHPLYLVSHVPHWSRFQFCYIVVTFLQHSLHIQSCIASTAHAWKLFVFSSISWEALMVFTSLTSEPWFGAEVDLCCVWMAEHVRKHKHRSHYMDSGGEHCRVCVINSTEKHHLLFGATWPPFPRFES